MAILFTSCEMESLLLPYSWDGLLALAVAGALVLVVSAYFLLWRAKYEKTPSKKRAKVHFHTNYDELHHFCRSQAARSRVEDVPGATPRTLSLNIYYGTQTGTGEVFARQLAAAARDKGVRVTTFDLKECDPEDTLTQEVSKIVV